MNAKEASDREVLTVEEASHLLGIGSNAVYDAVKRGEIPSIRIGRRIVIPKHKLNELLGKQPPQSRFPAELEATVRHLAQETQASHPGTGADGREHRQTSGCHQRAGRGGRRRSGRASTNDDTSSAIYPRERGWPQPAADPPRGRRLPGRTEGTLYTWRTKRTGPKAFRVGRHVRYRFADVESWLEAQQQ